MPTTFTKSEETAPNFYVVSAKDVVLGQLAVRIAKVLQGKHKASYTPNVDDGDFVIVTDAKEVVLTGNKDTQKVYRYHTGFVGGLKEVLSAICVTSIQSRLFRWPCVACCPKPALPVR